MDADYETVLLIVRECFVYRIPPRATSRGYKASDWDVNNFLWKGRLRVTAIGNQATLRLEDPNTGELFAASPYIPEKNTVEPVLDSSRYFVLRVEDQGRHAFLGLGFQERSEAFDFNVVLQDFVKRNRAEADAAEVKNEDTGPKVDYSLKEGEQISINIGNMPKRSKPRSSEKLDVIGSGAPAAALPFLPPPPSAAAAKSQSKQGGATGVGVFGARTDQFGRPIQQQQQAAPAATAKSNDDWGDFGGFGASKTSTSGVGNTPQQWTSFQ